MRTLLINNYDSFTYNLYQLISKITGVEPIVVNNDASSWSQVSSLDFSNIVISPGPGRPENRSDFGISGDAILDGRWPVLGVCLGHQGICHFFGGRVVHAPEPMHGRISAVHHDGSDLFKGIPSPFNVVRYHSLIAEELPVCLVPTAWTSDGLVMGVRHIDRALWGVQFHPESICSENGASLLANFLSCSSRVTGSSQLTKNVAPKLYARRLSHFCETDKAFASLFDDADPCFWLDSSAVIPGVSRYSFMGDALGPLSEVLSYDATTKQLNIRRGQDSLKKDMSVFDYIDSRLRELKTEVHEDLPFDFSPGYVGYFGYEMKAETGGNLVHHASGHDAQFIFADRVICFDHERIEIWLLCIDTPDEIERVRTWFAETETLLKMAGAKNQGEAKRTAYRNRVEPIEARAEAEAYLTIIEQCLKKIRDGESYEICLTNQMTAEAAINDLDTYLVLRRINPAPYSSFLRFGKTRVLCSSPELFLYCDRTGSAVSKPIKGTIRRGVAFEEDAALRNELLSSEKEKAENLMIVDLIRNDLGRVCKVGSVEVPSLFAIESYATVHQMVSTVRGQLKPDRTALDAVRAMFPGGSMTGAPKIRTMEILDELESSARGIYSGSIGYLSATGTAQLNIVIRTIVLHGSTLSIGVGGAITALSEPTSELEETQLKAAALLSALTAVSAEENKEPRLSIEGNADYEE